MLQNTMIFGLIFRYCVLFSVNCNVLDNVCHKDAFDCIHPNIDTTRKLVHDKCLIGNTLRRKLDVSLLECVKECLVTSQCTGINYRKNWKICDVTNKSTGTTLTNERDCVYSDIDTWPKGLGGKCQNKKCPAGRSCTVHKTTGAVECEITYCVDLPVIPNATCIEKFGLYRNIGSGNKFTCIDSLKLCGQPFAVCQKTGKWIPRFSCTLKPRNDCSDITDMSPPDDVYIICPADIYISVEVFCDLHTDGQKWTVIQKRFDGSVDFYRNWTSYEYGFGSAYGEYYIGNKVIHAITSQKKHVLRIIMTDFNGEQKYAEYSDFSIGDSTTQYQLSCSGYSGDAGDSLTVPHNGKKFYTYDKDNSRRCAKIYHGAWWYYNCHQSNLNGKYYEGGTSPHGKGMNWYKWHRHEYSMKSTIMMIRRA